jgi:hypothetical protein
MNIANESINTLHAGGTEPTKKMDNLLGLSDIVHLLKSREKVWLWIKSL